MHVRLGVMLFATATASYGDGIQPGRWETVTTTESVDIPGPVACLVRKTRGQTTRSSVCVTPEQAAAGPQGALKGSQTCHIARQKATGGQFSAEMDCERDGNRSVATTDGVYTPTTFSGKTRIEVNGGKSMVMTATISSRRLGDCVK